MPKFSEAMGLGKTQPELDFVDVELDKDMPLFVDPFAISQRTDELSRTCHQTVRTFFQVVVDYIRAKRFDEARALLQYLHEPNETRLGLSSGRPKGAGFGEVQAKKLYDALRTSSAVKTGFITALEDCELMIRGVSRDKISDLTTNIIRHRLVRYTRTQCALHGIPTASVALSPGFDPENLLWRAEYADVPLHDGKPVLLVPKVLVRRDPAYDHQKFYRHFVLNYLKAEELRADGGLVRALKSGKKVVYKKDLQRVFPMTKAFLAEFSRKHPEELRSTGRWQRSARRAST